MAQLVHPSSLPPVQLTEERRFSFVRPYADAQRDLPLESELPNVASILSRVAYFIPVGVGTRLLEVGVGGGRFIVLCAQRGLDCHGVEHNPMLYRQAAACARAADVSVGLTLGNAEEIAWLPNSFDVVIANSVLEHVEHYGRLLANIQAALRPGGVLFFNSTNKFALRSGEFPELRLYGWLPFRVRRRVRLRRHGRGVVDSSSIDYNQFTHPGLRRALHASGVSQVHGHYELLRPGDLVRGGRLQRLALEMIQRLPVLRAAVETFAAGAQFYCVK